MDISGITTYTYDSNGNLTEIWPQVGNRTTMAYYKENRLSVHKAGATVNTMTYDGDGLKRAEIASATRITLVWDGADYLQAMSGPMPVVNYHTVNGRIIGETTGSTRTDTMTDALGSVTGTVNSSQVVVNTYRYKPYGELLAKTGTAADPRFLFAGSDGTEHLQALKGLMRLGVSFPSKLSQATSSCLEADFLCVQNREAFRSPEKSTSCSLTGKKGYTVPYVTVEPLPRTGPCGRWGVWFIKFNPVVLRNKIGPGTQGYIMQHVAGRTSARDCIRGGVVPAPQPDFFEVWYFNKQNQIRAFESFRDITSTPFHDGWSHGKGYSCTVGSTSVFGVLKFYVVGRQCPKEWGYKGGEISDFGGNLVGGDSAPPGWSKSGEQGDSRQPHGIAARVLLSPILASDPPASKETVTIGLDRMGCMGRRQRHESFIKIVG